MNDTPTPSSERALPLAIPLMAAAIAIGAVVVLPGGLDGTAAPRPFVWRDVALVSHLSALPLAALLVAALWKHLPARLFPPVGMVVLGILFAVLARDGMSAAPAVRFGFAAGLGLGLVLLLSPLATRFATSNAVRSTPAAVVIAAAAAWLLPQVYLTARTRSDLERLDRLVDDMRLGEALPLARRIVDVDPQATLRGEPLAEVASRMADLLDDLRREANVALPASPSEEDVLARAEQFAILGETAAAVELLTDHDLPGPAAANLLGTIYETRGDWSVAQRWYQTALDRVAADEENGERARGLRGIAYCQRKRGRPAEAERTYLALLELSPTAETHFLIAQFYEDTQRADLARNHARRAMELSPAQYAVSGERLIQQLQTFQFGCWGVYRAELDSTAAGSAVSRGKTTNP